MINGTYYSNFFTAGSAVDTDLIETIESDLGIDNVVAKKVTLISPFEIQIDINNLGSYSKLWENSDGNYVVSLDASDVSVSSLAVNKSTSGSGIYLAIVF